MSGGAGLHLLAAVVIAAAGMAGGTFFAFVASPLALGVVAQAWVLRGTAKASAARRSIGLAALGGLLGLGLLAAGHPGPAVAALAASAAVLVHATRLSRASEPAPRGCTLPPVSDPWLHVGLAVDEGVRLALELRALARSWPDFGSVAADARIAADRNQEEGWLARPERAHEPTPPLEKTRLARVRLRCLGELEELSFSSEFEPQDPEIQRDYLTRARSRTTRVAFLRERGLARPALIFVHGPGRSELALGARALQLDRICHQLGCDLALYAPPPLGSGGAARGLLSGEVLWANAAVGQSIWELRRLTGLLRAEGAPAVGVLGMSLGGYVAAAFASVQDGLACTVAMSAPSSLDDCFWHLLPPLQGAAARAAGLSHHLLEHAWARHAPLRMRPRVPHAARLVIGGLLDRLVPPAQVEALWEHWGQPPVHWHPGAHLAWRDVAALRARLTEHLRDTLVAAG